MEKGVRRRVFVNRRRSGETVRERLRVTRFLMTTLGRRSAFVGGVAVTLLPVFLRGRLVFGLVVVLLVARTGGVGGVFLPELPAARGS